MPFVKVVKNKAYFKRYQVKYRRRRECKTDYQQRRRLVLQDKNKYASPKYRFVVRRTNVKIICQIIFATIKGDKVLCQATSAELQRFGLSAGLTNYAAAYCTGLLCARRLLANLKMDETYKGQEEVTGQYYDVLNEAAGNKRRPFRALLDVGLVRTSIGNRVFGAMKGACDGGICIPHSKSIFPGFRIEEKKEIYEVEKHRERIFGGHVQGYMDHLKEKSEEQYHKQFKEWIICLKEAKVESLEELYKKVHEEIRKNPKADKKPKRDAKEVKRNYLDEHRSIIETSKGKYRRDRKISRKDKQARVAKIIEAAKSKAAVMAEEAAKIAAEAPKPEVVSPPKTKE